MAATAGSAVLATAAAISAAPPATVTLTPLDTYMTGQFDESAAEIVKYDPQTRRIFVVNAQADHVDVLDAHDPSNLTKVGELQAPAELAGGVANSVDVLNGIVAVAFEAPDKTHNGLAAFFNSDDLDLLGSAETGALPDMITFTPNGQQVLTANEGEPDCYGGGCTDPEGSVTIIEMPRLLPYLQHVKHICEQYAPNAPWCQALLQPDFEATTIGFESFNNQEAQLKSQGVRIFGPGASVAQDFEPEYIAVAGDSRTAYVTLQENNAIAVVNLRSKRVQKILPLGYKDYMQPGNALDASDKEDEINITNWPVLGMYLPDSINAYEVGRKTFLVTANEGDSRDYDGFNEEERVKDLDLDPAVFPDAGDLQDDDLIGRLKVTSTLGNTDADPEYEALYAFGGRSFSIWDDKGNLVFDSGDQIEQITADLLPDDFNSNNDENGSFDSRSDDKGPEPEGLVIGRIGFRTYAFVGLERVGGVMIWDISNPYSPTYAGYFNNRDFSGDAEDNVVNQIGPMDLGPEGLDFIPAYLSPNHKPLLVVGNEVSGTTTVFEVDFLP